MLRAAGCGVFVAATIFGYGPGGASAADFPMNGRGAMAAGFSVDWSGPYAGLYGGWAGNGRQEQDPAGADASTEHVGLSGASAGVLAGANWQRDSLVFGVESDFGRAAADGTERCPNPAFSCAGAVEWSGSARARAGWAFDRVLLFAAGGIAFGKIEAETSPKVSGASGSFDSVSLGWAAGAGAEIRLLRNVSARAEYLFQAFEEETAPTGTLSGFRDVDITTYLHTLRVGLAFRF